VQWLSNISVRRPVFATVVILTLVVVGIVGYRNLGVDKFPKIDFPLVTVTTVYPGGAPTSIETEISDKIESAVNTVSGLETLTSISTEGASVVIAQFDLDKDPDTAVQEIQERINGVLSELPVRAKPPIVQKADPDAAPVAVLAIEADAPVRDITRVADTVVRRQIERLQDVGQVTLLGGQRRRIEIEVDPIRARAAGITALEVQRAVAVANVSIPGGSMIEGATKATIRIEGRALDPDQIGDLIVRQHAEHPVRVRDVASVLDTQEDADTAAVRDGKASVVLSIRKQSGKNTVEVVERIKSAMNEVRAGLPAGYKVEIVRDNSELIKTSASQVIEHLVLGSILAALVVLLFLGNFRSTFIAAIAIPVSIISTFALVDAAGFTLNLMTLLALALAVGIVIDDAIVVLENIYRHIDEKGMKPFPAAIQATREIGLAVLATTLSLMAVFLPVAFMSGIVGRFLLSFGLTMAFAIGVSLIVSFTLTPMMAARLLPPPNGERRRSFLERASDKLYKPIERGYMAILRFSLRRRWVVALAVIGSCATVPALAPRVGFGFIPLNDEAQFEIFMRAPEGYNLDATTLLAERIARQTRQLAPEVTHTVVTVAEGQQKQANVAKVYVRLTNPDQRTRTQEDVMDDVRKKVVDKKLLPGGTRAAVQLVNDFNVGGQQNAAVSYLIRGPDLDRLEDYGKTVVEKMRAVPGVVDLDYSIFDPSEESVLRPDFERAAALGVDPADITATLAVLVGGVEASTFEDRGEQYDVYVRAAERYRSEANLGVLMVPSRTGGQVPLTDVVTSETCQDKRCLGPSQITRTGRSRSVTITCNVKPGYAEADITAALGKIIDDLDMPPTYKAEPFARSKEAAKVQAAFGFAMLLAFVFMYLVLAAQFESWLYPFVIMLALPLSFPFALISLYLLGQQLNIFTMLGILVLFGMVKKNSILQVDQTNQLRARGMSRYDAVLEANRERLRPILMTTFAFVAGMLPLVFSNGIGAGFSKAMAGVVVGGQLLSLLLTLVAIPVAYTAADDLRDRAGRAWRRVFGRERVDRGAGELVAHSSHT
jgi:hydrophobe/amphiphile efflux-1 (HAE1) family protein